MLAGGPSSEREISLKSGRAVYEGLKSCGQDVHIIEFENDIDFIQKKLEGGVTFLALHGGIGENGTIQALLEKSGIAYTGSGIQASRLAMDKVASRKLFFENGLKVPKYAILKPNTGFRGLGGELEMPLVIKPRSGGSSIGLSIIGREEDVESAIARAFKHDESVIAEEYVPGRELTVGILDGKALPVIEIKTRHNIYDFEAKYNDEETRYIMPPDLPKNHLERAQSVAERAHEVLGCRDFSRVDLKMDEGNDPYVLEINTIPGMTRRSLMPKAAMARGISFENLFMKLIDMASRRKGTKNGENKEYCGQENW